MTSRSESYAPPRMTHRAGRSLLLLTVLSAYFIPVFAQGHQGDVMITVVKDKVVALPAAGSVVEEGLSVNETIITAAARGPAGLAQTSSRLLGFSTSLRRWTEVHLGVEESVERHQVLPRLLVVQTNRRVHGFQESRGHWFSEALGPNEIVKQLHGRGHVAVTITTERALAFSAFTGGFFPIRWSAHEQLQAVDKTNDTILVRTTARQLVFRSQRAGWTEMK